LIHFYKRLICVDMPSNPGWKKLASLGFLVGVATLFHFVPHLVKKPEADLPKPTTLSGLINNSARAPTKEN